MLRSVEKASVDDSIMHQRWHTTIAFTRAGTGVSKKFDSEKLANRGPASVAFNNGNDVRSK
jgi:hypothetical protein